METRDRKKSKKIKRGPCVIDSLNNADIIEYYRGMHDASRPFTHVVLDPLMEVEDMIKIQESITSTMKANFKETDLYKLFQTEDLSMIDESQKDKINIIRLRDRLYSHKFVKFIERITGCPPLNDKVDCSINIYNVGCHLLCHDDVIGTRCVAYILYLTDPEDSWDLDDGGALELYDTELVDCDGLSINVPLTTPSASVLPKFNTMALFVVQPGKSFHSVQEVFAKSKTRLSVSGWFHTDAPTSCSLAPNEMHSRSLNLQYNVINRDIFEREFLRNKQNGAKLKLTSNDKKILKRWINPAYLQPSEMRQISARFCVESFVQLNDFLREDVLRLVLQPLLEADAIEVLRKSHSVYGAGLKGLWRAVGPSDVRRYLRYEDHNKTPAARSPSGGGRTNGDQKRKKGKSQSGSDRSRGDNYEGRLLAEIRDSLFRSDAFLRYVHLLTSVSMTGYSDEIRRFRPGLDYIVAHVDPSEICKKELVASMCFVDDRGEDDEGSWQSGEVGCYESYISTSDDLNADATAVVEGKESEGRGSSSEEEEDEAGDEDGDIGNDDSDDDENLQKDTSLLTLFPTCNAFSLVLRDENVTHFVKYASFCAPSSRWDIHTQYSMDVESDEEGL